MICQLRRPPLQGELLDMLGEEVVEAVLQAMQCLPDRVAIALSWTLIVKHGELLHVSRAVQTIGIKTPKQKLPSLLLG